MYWSIKWQAKARASNLLIKEYIKTVIKHNNSRAMLIANVLNTNSFEAFSPVVISAFASIVVTPKNKVGIQ